MAAMMLSTAVLSATMAPAFEAHRLWCCCGDPQPAPTPRAHRRKGRRRKMLIFFLKIFESFLENIDQHF
jgi:hypothetical protein